MQTGAQKILGIGLVIYQAQLGQPIDHLIDHVRVKPLVDQTTGQGSTRTGRCIQQGQGSLPASIRIIRIRSRGCRCGTSAKAASTWTTATAAGPPVGTPGRTVTTRMVTCQGFVTHISIGSTVCIFQTASESGAMPKTQDRRLHQAAVLLEAVILLLKGRIKD